MHSEKQHQQVFYEDPFPLKTYEEMLSEKNRRTRFRQIMVVVTGVFLLFGAVIVGVGSFWNPSGSVLKTVAAIKPFAPEQAHSGETSSQQSGTDHSFTLSRQQDGGFAEQKEDTVKQESEKILVVDVSEIVSEARTWVVGIEAETYHGLASQKTGSGVILTENGYIMTNSHVIADCDSIIVTLDNGKEYTAFVVGDDSYSDIAVLKIDAHDLSAARLGDSDEVKVGQAAIAIGNPTGQLQGTTTFGVISGVDRNVTVNHATMNLLQTDAAINEGNSGGPLLNQKGQVVGINSAKVTLSGYEGLGFAIPMNTAKPIAEELVRNGAVSGRPMLGVTAHRLSAMASNFYALPQGIYLSAVESGSGAAEAGLQAGDVIVEIEGNKVHTMSAAYLIRSRFQAGDSVEVTYYRRENCNTVRLQLMDQKDASQDSNF